MLFNIIVENVQHLSKLELSLDLSKNQLICIVGKNGVGKTTLIRAIRNITKNNTFQETGAPYIFSSESKITYDINNSLINFEFNPKLGALDTKQLIPQEIKDSIQVELPIPHGERFNHFRLLSEQDEEIRAKIAIGDYSKPDELINLLNNIYKDNRFEKLKEVKIKNNTYYFILKDEDERYYIREDYLSSGEYFVINLYKHIKSRKMLIVIDEIDISLDASAQVNLIDQLKLFCKEYSVNIMFTTHSLALMKKVDACGIDINYMELDKNSNEAIIEPKSYNFVKSLLFGFQGYDRYILTEDECLAHYISYLIQDSGKEVFYKYQIIKIGGASQVIDLKRRNKVQEFLSNDENILSVLDGDQIGERYLKGCTGVTFIPFQSVEIEIYNRYHEKDSIIPRVGQIDGKSLSTRSKNLFWRLTKKPYGAEPVMSAENIYKYLSSIAGDGVETLTTDILSFLNK
ncbi:MAG: ABC-type dipeptide/oligopeptide/nickel transport system ATPase subunit [Colwellia sp.]